MTYHLNGLGQVKTGTTTAKPGTTGTTTAVDNTARDWGTALTVGGGLVSSIIGGATGTPATTTPTTETPVTYTPAPSTDWTPLYIGGGILLLGGLGWWVLSQRKVAANRRGRRKIRANPERFRIYDMGDVPGDRYTIVDAKPTMSMTDGRQYYSYFGMNAHPFHPQGIGMYGDFSSSEWRSHVISRFRGLGKRIKMTDLPPEARKAAEQFIRQSTGPARNGRRSKRRRGSKRVGRNSHRGSGSRYRDVLTLKVGTLVGVHPRPRFDITLEERTDSPTSHARYHVSIFDRRTNHSWGMDFPSRARAEGYMDDKALELAKVGDDWDPRKRVTPNGYRGAGFKRAPRVGTRVIFDPNPASLALYSTRPRIGERGTVSTVAGPGGKMSFVRGPGGGLVYVDWDEQERFIGVSLHDLSKAGTVTANRIRKNARWKAWTGPMSVDEVAGALRGVPGVTSVFAGTEHVYFDYDGDAERDLGHGPGIPSSVKAYMKRGRMAYQGARLGRGHVTPNYAYEHMSHPGRYDERGRPVRNARLKASTVFKLSESIGVVRDAAPAEQKGFMPPGVASRISKMGPGYYSYGFGKRGESLRRFPRADMSGALTSTRIAASRSGETHYFIDNAAGYPVVVRIFEPSGKTVFRVEEYAQKFMGEKAMAHLVKKKTAA